MYKAFLVEGIVNVSEALASGWSAEGVYATEAAVFALRQNGPPVAGALDRQPVFIIEDKELGRLSTQRQPHGVVAVFGEPSADGYDFAQHARLLYLDGVADPGNAGTLLRTAEWFGVEAVLAAPGSVEWYNPKVVAAARGSLFRLRLGVVAATDLREHLPEHVVLLSDLAGESYDSVVWPERGVLVLGSESHGPSAGVRAVASIVVTIPSRDSVPTESLNVAVAGGILLASWDSPA